MPPSFEANNKALSLFLERVKYVFEHSSSKLTDRKMLPVLIGLCVITSRKIEAILS